MQLSKELLGNVIGKEIKEFVIEKNELRYILENDINSIPELYYINIYELSYKCKEWAFTQEDFILESAFVSKGKFTSCYCVAEKNFSYPTLKETFHDNMEQQSIFKACQWILDNKTNKEG